MTAVLKFGSLEIPPNRIKRVVFSDGASLVDVDSRGCIGGPAPRIVVRNPEIKPGAVVALKSGGPDMTVSKVLENNMVETVWQCERTEDTKLGHLLRREPKASLISLNSILHCHCNFLTSPFEVAETGVEPARPNGHMPLKHARLPIPPLG